MVELTRNYFQHLLQDRHMKLLELKKLLERLPRSNHAVLKYIFQHFVRYSHLIRVLCCCQCCGSGSGIRCLFDPGIWNRFFPDPVSRIPKPYFLELGDNFLGKGFYNSLKIGPKFCEICGDKKGYENKLIFKAIEEKYKAKAGG
jgi:hypothetical protein